MTPPLAADGASSEDFVDALALEELPEGSQRTVYFRGRRILLCWSDNVIHAMEDICPHALQPLKGGAIRNGTFQCPKHGACFDLNTGKPINRLTATPLTLFHARIRGQRIEIAPLRS